MRRSEDIHRAAFDDIRADSQTQAAVIEGWSGETALCLQTGRGRLNDSGVLQVVFTASCRAAIAQQDKKEEKSPVCRCFSENMVSDYQSGPTHFLFCPLPSSIPARLLANSCLKVTSQRQSEGFWFTPPTSSWLYRCSHREYWRKGSLVSLFNSSKTPCIAGGHTNTATRFQLQLVNINLPCIPFIWNQNDVTYRFTAFQLEVQKARWTPPLLSLALTANTSC